MKPLLRFFVQRPLLVSLMMIFALLLGIQSFRSAVVSAFPDFDFGLFTIVTPSPGRSPEDVELSITTPLEEELLKVDGIKNLSSNSLEGVSAVLAQVREDASRTELDEIGREIQRAIDRASGRLPADLPRKPEMMELKPKDIPVIELLVAGRVSEELLRQVAKKIEDELREFPGVAGVDLKGYRDREVRILLNPLSMHQLGISYSEIEQAIRARNLTETGGTVESALAEKEVIAVGRFVEPKDVAEVIVRAGEQGNYVRIRDIAKVVSDYEDWTERSYVDGVPGIAVSVRKNLNANELKVVERIKTYVENSNSKLPADVSLTITNDLSRYTTAMLSMLAQNAVAGMVLVFFILILFFPLRSTLWVVAGIPTAVALGFAMMPLLGLTINQISLAAIILMMGLLVDDAVVASESIFRHAESGVAPKQAAIDGAAAVAPPILTSAATTLLAFMPLVFLGGDEGRYMWMLPAMVIMIIAASLFECLFILPSHMASSLEKDPAHQSMAHWFGVVERVYRKLIGFMLAHRYLASILMTLTFVSVIGLGSRMVNVDLYPEVDSDVLHIKAELPSGSSFDNTYQQLRKVEKYVRSVIDESDLQNTRITVGNHDIGRPHELSAGGQRAWGVIDIYLEPLDRRQLKSLDLTRTLREAFPRFTQFESLMILPDMEGPPSGYPVEVNVIANGDERGQVAEDLLAYVRTLPGVTESWTSYDVGKDIVDLQLQHESIAAYGLSVIDITRAIRVAYDGYIVDELQTVDERIKYRLQLQDPDRGKLETLRSLTLVNAAGERIPLRAVVEFEIKQGQSAINHYFGKRTETVFAEIDRDVTSVAAINQTLEQYIAGQNFEQRFPGLRLRQGGELAVQTETLDNLAGTLVVVLVAIFFVMVLLFNSLTQPIIVLGIIPLGFAGVLLAFALHGYDLSTPAMMGTLGLAGVLVNSSIVLIDKLNQSRVDGLVAQEDIVAGSVHRLRPILITSLTTVAGLAPAAYGLLGSNPFLTPMIMAMLWGVAFGTFLTLLYLPCLYAIEQDLRSWFNRRGASSGAAA